MKEHLTKFADALAVINPNLITVDGDKNYHRLGYVKDLKGNRVATLNILDEINVCIIETRDTKIVSDLEAASKDAGFRSDFDDKE